MQHGLPGADVIAAEDEVQTGCAGLENADGAVAVILGIFDHDHAVRASGDGPAGGDIGAGAARKRKRGLLAHLHLADEVEDGRNRVGTAEGIGCAKGIAVHGGAVKIRHVFVCADVLREHAAERGVERHGFGALPDGAELRFDQPEHLLRRFHLQHGLPFFSCFFHYITNKRARQFLQLAFRI